MPSVYIYGVKQREYCEKVKEFYAHQKFGRNPKAFVKTYGCQQNVSDSEKYTGMLAQMGFEIVPTQNDADVVLFNTCAIRENAENKTFGNLGWIKSLKDLKPDLFIIMCGCMTEQECIVEKIKSKYNFVDLVFGTHAMHEFPKLFYEALISGRKTRKPFFAPKSEENIILEGAPAKRNNSLKAFVSVMYGCNNFCSYCIVPYVRGRERSRKSEDIITEFKGLLAAGYKDITLLGQNVNSYGRGLDEKIDFPELLKTLDCFEGEYIIRFMTSHPKDATNKLFDTIASSKHIAHHIHLPVQCGSDRVLGQMNRKYTSKSYLEIVNYARQKIPDITFTSDIIVGFPGETYSEFLETVQLIKDVKYSSLFTFIYSPRNGTPAAKMRDDISKQEKTKWLLELLKVQEDISVQLGNQMHGKRLRVLAESFDEKNSCLLCRTSGNVIAEVPGSKAQIGEFLDIEITGSKKESLKGKII